MIRNSTLLVVLLLLAPALTSAADPAETLADALLGKYDAGTTKDAALDETEIIAMIKANNLTTASFKAGELPAEAHNHTAGAAHSEEDELAEAMLAKYDADKNSKLNEAELIAMIKANTFTTKSFSALAPVDPHAGHDHAAEEALADALLDKYDAGTTKDKALNEAELIAMIKANKLTDKSFVGLPGHAGHDHGGGAHSEEEELADALLTKYDLDKSKTLNEKEMIEMFEANSHLTRESFSDLPKLPTKNKLDAASAVTAGSSLAVAAVLAVAMLL